MGNETYVIQGGAEGRERLRLLSEVMGRSTRALIAEVGVVAGSTCLDVGCGGGDVAFELAREVGPQGRVVGVDLDETKIEMARDEAAELELSNVDFEVQDVVGWEPDELFDLVYARFLLSHLADPLALLRSAHLVTRPGGAVVVEDVDFRGHFAEPDSPALGRFVELYTKSAKTRGGDPNIGPRLPGLLREAGFVDVQMTLVQPAALVDGIKLLTCVTFENIAQALLADGLIGESELREAIEELYVFSRDPHTVLGGPRIFQAWGRSATDSPEMSPG